MNILVTGGTGFIGTHLVAALLRNGHGVSVIDDLSASRDTTPPGFRSFYQWDAANKHALDHVISNDEITHIVHLATRNITVSEQDPVAAFSINSGGTAILLKKAKQYGIQRVVYTSTSSIYGDRMPALEEHEPNPRTVYSVSKLAGEMCVRASSVPSTILRLSNVYGPGQTPESNPYCGVIGHFMRASVDGSPLVIYGNGEATRDYTYIDDVVHAIVMALHASIDGTFNISTGVETSTNYLSSTVKRVVDRKLMLEWKESRSIDVVPRRVVDSTKFQRSFGWKPYTSLEDGLRKTYDWWLRSKIET